MSTKRTPIGRPPKRRITAKAVELFRQMEETECSCERINWNGDYWDHERCAGCERWSQLHGELHRELRAAPWQWPVYEGPDVECNYTPQPEAVKLYGELKRAAAA